MPRPTGDAPDEGGHCDHCPLDRLDVAQASEEGQLLRRAVDLQFALRLGIHLSLDEVCADEFYAMTILEEERNTLDRERLPEPRA